LVSVCVLTYNHREFINTCVDSVLAQETDFDLEILLGENESSDGTREICTTYANADPDRVRLVLSSREEVFHFEGKPTGQWNFLKTLGEARGEYVALVDGDDYWSDSSKLQRQVDLLERSPGSSGCFHGCRVEYDDGLAGPERLAPSRGRQTFTIEDILDRNFVPTPSIVFRRAGLELPAALWDLPMGDWPLHLLNLMRGPYEYLDREMSVYRVHSEGAWSQLARSQRLKGSLAFYDFAEDQLGPDYAGLIRKKRRAYRFRESRLGRWSRPLRKRLRLRSRLSRLPGPWS
jgi:glycosyltransferase involved in cell wall biosynthesis